MTLSQEIITIGMVVLGTALTRYLPFLLFPAGKPTPKYIQYLGKVLPGAVFGLLVIYSLRNVSLFSGSHGIRNCWLFWRWSFFIYGNARCFCLSQEERYFIWFWCRWSFKIL